jgi:predicted PolB exonuclease-like 3'-5' exonuclease
LIIGQRLVRKLHPCYSLRDASYTENQEIKDFIKNYNQLHSKKLQFDGKLPVPV